MPRFFIIILRSIIFFFFIIIIFFFDIILTQVGPTALEVIALVGSGVAAKVAPDVRDTLLMIAAARAAVVSFVMLRVFPYFRCRHRHQWRLRGDEVESFKIFADQIRERPKLMPTENVFPVCAKFF